MSTDPTGSRPGGRPEPLVSLKPRPSYPSVERQFLGVLTTIVTILLIEFLSARTGSFPFSGFCLFLAIAFGSFWSGLRAGVICSAVVIGYMVEIQSFPGSAFIVDPKDLGSRIVYASVVYPTVAVIAGLLERTIRGARTREYDARLAAEAAAREQMESELHLQSSEDMQRLVVDSAMDAVITITEDGKITLWNPSAESLFGWTSEEVLGKYLSDMIVPEQYREAHNRGLIHLAETGEGTILGKRMDLTGRAKDGREFDIELSVAEHVRGDTKVYVGFVRDVSERKEAEEAIRRLNEDLERRVQERTAELDAALRNVEEQREVAVEANRVKSEFVSHMSHELRTPLNAVIGYAQLLEMQHADAAIREPTKAILRAGRHLLNLINEVLDLARIDSGQLSLSLESVGLDEVLHSAVDLVRMESQAHGVVISVDEASLDGVKVEADRRRLLQVFINLLTNGIKYNRPQGEVRIWGEADGARTRSVYFADTGLGFSEDDQRALFEPFVRFGDHPVEGSGLGLVLPKHVMELMGGALSLSSTSPKGSTFCVTMETSDSGLNSDSSVLELSEHEGSISGNHSILYIEDNLPNIRLLELAFAKWGNIEFVTAVTGQAGLDEARSRIPDLILLDLHLPDIQGDEVLHCLMCDPVTANIPVILVSADASSRQVKKLLKLGARDYLTKPVELRRLVELIDRVLNTSG